jgi:predicted nucleotidyltransferase
MARGNIREYLKGEVVWRKKYFYVLRPLLAMLWIDQGLGPVPIEFGRLVDATVSDPSVRSAINGLLSAKRSGVELDRGPRFPAISEFIQQEMARLEDTGAGRPSPAPPVDALNELFRSTLQEVWHNERPA